MFSTHVLRRAAARLIASASAAVALSQLAGCASVPASAPHTTGGSPGERASPSAAGPQPSLITSPIGLSTEPPAPWRLALLPRQTKPVTDFSVVDLEGQRVLRVAAARSYGKLLHPVGTPAHARARKLAWDWRVDRAPDADLRHRAGDDVALRVCAFFDWPIDRLSLLERTRLVAAEALAGQDLPTAAICYVWDKSLPPGTLMPNAFTRRLRMIVVDGEGGVTRHWRRHARDLHDDFRTAFADEWRDGDQAPAVSAVVIGSDTDNTGGDGLAFVRAIDLSH